MRSRQVALGIQGLVFASLLVAAGCSSSVETTSPSGSSASQQERFGTIGLQLQPVSGITVTSVKYTVTTGNAPGAAVVRSGNLPTPGTSSNFNFGIPLPIGTGYYISLSGVAQESANITCTSAFGPFAVLPNQASPFNMTLTCVDATSGDTITSVNVKTDACPRLVVGYVVAEPNATDVGKSINLESAAHDLDDVNKPISFAWSVDAPSFVGDFHPVNAANTSFFCANVSLNLPVTVTADNGDCKKSLPITISCKDYTCGDGRVDPAAGETCDWAAGPGHPADPTCPMNCVKVCGNGIVEGDEQCDPLPANPITCWPPGSPNQCQQRIDECGDGFVQPGGVCDTLGNIGPDNLPLDGCRTCSADCTAIVSPVCGDGVVSACEACDDGVGTPSAPIPKGSRGCTIDCKSLAPPACIDCEQAGDCFASSDNCENAAFSSAQKKNCYDVAECILSSGCLKGAGTLGKCYCGTLSTAACGAAPYDLTLPGAPNGACAALMQAGQPGVISNAGMLGALTNKSRPAGAAGQRLNCDKAAPTAHRFAVCSRGRAAITTCSGASCRFARFNRVTFE